MTSPNSDMPSCPVLRGAAFQAAYKSGKGAAFLFDAVKQSHADPAPFSRVENALAKLADRIAWRLVMAGKSVDPDGDTVVTLATNPNLHLIEMTELLALVFEDAPVTTYDRRAPAATFWNWFDWAAGGTAANDQSDSMMTDMRRDERMAAGAAAVAVLNARAAITMSC